MERKRNDDVVATIIACTMSNVMIMTIMNVVQMITIDVVMIMVTTTMTTTTTIYYGRIKAVFLMNRRIQRMAMDNAIHNSSRDMDEKAI
jgi:hypothetical protein